MGSNRYGSQGAPKRRSSGGRGSSKGSGRPRSSAPPASRGGGFTVEQEGGRTVIRQQHYQAHGSRLTDPGAYGGGRGGRGGRSGGSHSIGTKGPRRPMDTRTALARKRRFIIIGVIAVIVIAVFIGFRISQAGKPIEVMVNGTNYEVPAGTTVENIATGPYVTVQAGNLLDVNGFVLQEGGGERYSAKVNGETCTDVSTQVKAGDIVSITRGLDIPEDSTSAEAVVEHQVSITGNGPISALIRHGADGLENVITGTISGKVKKESIQKSENTIVKKFKADDDNRIVALTFNEGPGEYTQQIVETLISHNAKATFFVNGADVVANPSLAKAIVQSGSQIAMHAYENKDLVFLDDDAVVESIASTHDAILEATGVDTNVMRAPNMSFDSREWKLAENLVAYVIGASVDAHDLQAESAAAIVDSVVTNVEPGDVVLLHGGGGDASKTVEALPSIIDRLQADGYTLVTIDEMISMSTIPEA